MLRLIICYRKASVYYVVTKTKRLIVQEIEIDHITKWYMYKPKPVLKNGTHKILWDFAMQTDHQIPAKRPVLVIINKKDILHSNWNTK